MEIKYLDPRRCLLAGMASFAFVLASPAGAVETVAPGETLTFFQADGGERDCRAKDLGALLGCSVPPWFATIPIVGWQEDFPILEVLIRTRAVPADNKVEAAFSSNIGWNILDVGIPHYATARVYNDFTIDDPGGFETVVDTTIAVTYTWEGLIAGVGNYEGEISASLEVEDITDPSAPVGVGGIELLDKDRQGDVTLEFPVPWPSGGGSAYDLNGETASLTAKLRRGGTYRVWFKAEAYGAPIVITEVEAAVRAKWTDLSVTVEEDVTALLLEIKRLLLTPPGRRPGYPLKPFQAKNKSGKSKKGKK